MFRLKNQLSHGRFFSISVVAVFVAAYAVYGLWLFGTNPAISDHAVTVGGLITYAGLLVIVRGVVRRVRQW